MHILSTFLVAAHLSFFAIVRAQWNPIIQGLPDKNVSCFTANEPNHLITPSVLSKYLSTAAHLRRAQSIMGGSIRGSPWFYPAPYPQSGENSMTNPDYTIEWPAVCADPNVPVFWYPFLYNYTAAVRPSIAEDLMPAVPEPIDAALEIDILTFVVEFGDADMDASIQLPGWVTYCGVLTNSDAEIKMRQKGKGYRQCNLV